MKNLLGAIVSILCCSAWSLAGEVSLSFSFDPASVSYEPRGAYEKVLLADAILPEDAPGTPWLPALFVNVLTPSGATVLDVRAEADEILLRHDVSVLPAQPPQKRSGPRNAFVPASPAAYAQTAIIPASLASSVGDHLMGGHSFVSVRLNPVRYVPAEKKLYLAQNLRLAVAYSEPKARLAAPAAQLAQAAARVQCR